MNLLRRVNQDIRYRLSAISGYPVSRCHLTDRVFQNGLAQHFRLLWSRHPGNTSTIDKPPGMVTNSWRKGGHWEVRRDSHTYIATHPILFCSFPFLSYRFPWFCRHVVFIWTYIQYHAPKHKPLLDHRSFVLSTLSSVNWSYIESEHSSWNVWPNPTHVAGYWQLKLHFFCPFRSSLDSYPLNELFRNSLVRKQKAITNAEMTAKRFFTLSYSPQLATLTTKLLLPIHVTPCDCWRSPLFLDTRGMIPRTSLAVNYTYFILAFSINTAVG